MIPAGTVLHVHLVSPEGLTDAQVADAADLLARLVADGAALGWVDPPSSAAVAALLRAAWSAAPGEAALAVATVDDASAAATDDASAAATDDASAAATDGASAAATDGGQAAAHRAARRRLIGLAYWRRYERPTHRPHADVEKVAVALDAQGRGAGRRLMAELIAAARAAQVEVLTLDLRGDNERAAALYESLGFERYGRLPRFVAVGDRRWDKLFYALDLRAS